MKEKKMMKKQNLRVAAAIITVLTVTACNNGLNAAGTRSTGEKAKFDRSQRTAIDVSNYIDFTIPQNNAMTFKKEDLLFTMGDRTYRNENSYIKVNRSEGTIEINSDCGEYNGKKNCQIYGKYGFEILAASSDCLYIRQNKNAHGTLLINGESFKDEQIPDLAVCLPLYGFSRNRLEISPIMKGYMVMPSGTYWSK
jgi:hypothetical protein